MSKDETSEIVPAIVSEELWHAANAVLKKRSDDVKSQQGFCNHANLLTGKLYCTCCGTACYRRDSVDRKAIRTASGFAPARSRTALIPSPSTRRS